MRPGSVAGRRHIELAGIGLGVGDEFGDRLGRKRWMHLHAVILVADARDRRDVADKIVFELFIQRRVDRVWRPAWSSVYPSADASTTASVAMLPPAPGRFSMMNCWPKRSDSHCAIRRAAMSGAPPAANPTKMRTGRAG